MKIALVTGANKGIGLEITRQLAELDHTVLLGTRDEVRGLAAEKLLRSDGLDVRFLRLDVTDQSTIQAAAKHIEREHGRLDVLVNNAGINAVNPGYTATDMSPEAERPAAMGAAVAVRYATLPDDGTTGGFFDEDGSVPW
jgi:NAD(P)-dependent dehydrogenase (short-subunit alcohol dehydrogenase family)